MIFRTLVSEGFEQWEKVVVSRVVGPQGPDVPEYHSACADFLDASARVVGDVIVGRAGWFWFTWEEDCSGL